MKNIFIYVSDALRYDHVPKSIGEEGDVIPTLAPAGYTPISFSSLLTGLEPRKHGVRSFHDRLEEETGMDLFRNHCYYDHPDGPMAKNVMESYSGQEELGEIEQPFIHVERALDTHEPYAQIGHGNELPEEPDRSGEQEERYRGGVRSTEEHFWSHVQELKERGIYEDTLIIFTSDHGEFLGENRLFRERNAHNKPMHRELLQVPTVFLNHDTDWDRMRTTDIMPTALSIAGKEKVGEGKDLTSEEPPEKGYTMLQVNTSPLVVTGCEWNWNGEDWERGRGGLRTDLATVALDLIDPVRSRLRHTKLADLMRPDSGVDLGRFNEEKRDEEPEELEDLDV
ncbi:MAG: sulfatase-like hydrolase/transferase [Candidatus Nanohaloarchaea archaeon]